MSRPRSPIRRFLPLGMVALLLSACQQVGDSMSAGSHEVPPPEPVVVAPEPVVVPEPVIAVAHPPPPRPVAPAPAPARPAATGTPSGGVVTAVPDSTTSTASRRPASTVTIAKSAGPKPPEITVSGAKAKPVAPQQPMEVEVAESPSLATSESADAEAAREAQDALVQLQESGAEPAEALGDEAAVAEPAIAIPQFPWPPPRASASAVIPAGFLEPSGVGSPTLGDIADEISRALDTGGYFERSYFGAPGGFAMVTRLERINPDGTPKDEAERWTVGALPLTRFSLSDYLRALFTAPSGHYRIIVFVVSSQPFAQSESEVERSEALAWLSEGLNRLPDNIALAPYTPHHTVTALIYEFEQPGSQEAMLMLPGNLMGRVHLERAHVWDALRQ